MAYIVYEQHGILLFSYADPAFEQYQRIGLQDKIEPLHNARGTMAFI